MKRLAIASLVFFLAFSAWASAQEGEGQKSAPEKEKKIAHQYVGVSKCSMCHKSKARGNQVGQWMETGHSKAYATLAGDAAKELAKKQSIEDPQNSPKCLKCHVTAYGADVELLASSYTMEDGVSCETCHGPGGDYMKLSIMKDKEKAMAAGLVIPGKELCVTCHNEESPSYVKFDYDKMFPKIAHPIPVAEEEKPAQE